MMKAARVSFPPLLALTVVLAFAARPLVAAPDDVLDSASFAKGLNDDKSPKEISTNFATDDTVCLSVKLKNRPEKGVIGATFWFRNEPVTEEIKVDLATVKTGNAADPFYVGFKLKPEEPFAVSDQYRVETTLDGQPLGTYTFRIDPPSGAIISTVAKVELAPAQHDLKKEPDFTGVSEFKPTDVIHLSGRGDMGKLSWLQTEWFVNGQLDDAGTQTVTYAANRESCPFNFKYRPEDGWKAGKHEVVLLLNGKEAARKAFTVKAPGDTDSADAVMPAPVLRKATLNKDDGKGKPGDAVETFEPDAKILHFVCELEAPVASAAGVITWRIVDAGDGEFKDVLMAKAPLAVKGAERLSGKFTASRDLPEGKYEVEMIIGDKVLAKKEFEIKWK